MLNNQAKAVDDFEGDLLLINYWATWCKPCLEEIPELNDFNRLPKVTVLAYNFDNLEGALLNEQLQTFNVQYSSILNDPASLFGQERPNGLLQPW